MTYKIEFIPEGSRDYQKLDGSIKKLVNKKVDELSKKLSAAPSKWTLRQIALDQYLKNCDIISHNTFKPVRDRTAILKCENTKWTNLK